MLNNYCVDAVCYNNNINNSIFSPEDCNRNLCVSETVTPTVPDIRDHSHWFFYALYIGGGIHLLLTLAMVAFFVIFYAPHYSHPDLEYLYLRMINWYVTLCALSLVCTHIL